MSNDIKVVYSTNETFYNYTYVSLCSLIDASRESFLDIYILVTNLTDKAIESFTKLQQSNIRVQCVFLNSYVDRIDLRGIKHLSKEALYRLFIPIILPDAEKVLYIDSDTIVRRDIKELYDCDLHGNPIGAIHECETIFRDDHARTIGMLNPDNMFNSGVLLMDCKRFECNCTREKCLDLLASDYKLNKRKYIYLDQDLLNIVLEGNVTYLDNRWNVQTQYCNRLFLIKDSFKKHYKALCNDSWIMHFAGSNKPWNDLNVPFAGDFWKEVKKTVRSNEILEDTLWTALEHNKLDFFERVRFPYEKVAVGSNIVLYGAGMVGKSFYQQLRYTRYAKVVLWVDRSVRNCDGIDVRGIEAMFDEKMKYDHVIIAIEDTYISESVKSMLVSAGVKASLIVWDNYTDKCLE